jgi:hypothetical protein
MLLTLYSDAYIVDLPFWNCNAIGLASLGGARTLFQIVCGSLFERARGIALRFFS